MAKSRTRPTRGPAKRRTTPRCSACGEEGHNKASPKCPKKADPETASDRPPTSYNDCRVWEHPPPESDVWSHVETPAAPLFVFRDLGELEGMLAREDSGSVAGAYVKVAPSLRPSEREGLDLPALRRSLEERGALGVVWEPRALPESRTESAPIPEAVDPREAIRGWFERQAGVDDATREAALELCLRLAEEEGI